MKQIDRNTMKPGDIVGVLRNVSIGWGNFRYEKVVPLKVARITPAKTKVVMENGVEYDRYRNFYELDEDAKNRTHIAECAESLNNGLYELQELKRQGKLFNKNDETIVALSELMDKAMEVLIMAKKEINGVKVNAESIVTSLQIIKTVCEDNDGNCGKCPLYDEVNGCCSMSDITPYNWKINDSYGVWRALL